jgi:3-oxoacyl-[acyl-carrier protein] reductase
MTEVPATPGQLLTGKTALITGGASGMGRAAARLFAAHGAHVIIGDVNAAGTETVVEEIKGKGGSVEGHAVDLADQPALEAFTATITANHEVLDVLYSHAGITGPTNLDYDFASWTRAFQVNTWVGAYLTQQFLPLLRRSAAASVIYTASTAGLSAAAPLPTYSATKGAVIMFMKAVAKLLASDGIRVNAICPGATDTASMRRDYDLGIVTVPLEVIASSVPLGRMAQPEDIADVALFLASDASRYMTGVAVPVDGGATA